MHNRLVKQHTKVMKGSSAPEGAGTQHSSCKAAPQVISAMIEGAATQHALPFLQHCLSGFQHEFALCAAAAAAAAAAPSALEEAEAAVVPAVPPTAAAAADEDMSQDAAAGEAKEEPLMPQAELLDCFVELLPLFTQAAAEAGAVQLARHAHALAHAHLPSEHPAFSKVHRLCCYGNARPRLLLAGTSCAQLYASWCIARARSNPNSCGDRALQELT